MRNQNILVFSNALNDVYYKKGYIELPEKELPFFEILHKLLNKHYSSNDLKNPKKIVLKEFIKIIEEIITHFKERIDRKSQ